MSSKRHLRRKGCAGKVRHTTRAFAEIALKKCPARDGREMNVYGCGHCGGWHVGHLLQQQKSRLPGVNERRW